MFVANLHTDFIATGAKGRIVTGQSGSLGYIGADIEQGNFLPPGD